MEDRSICAVSAAQKLVNLSRISIFRIADDPMSRFFAESEERTEANQRRLMESGIF